MSDACIRLRMQARFVNSPQSVRPLARRRQGEFPLPAGQTSGCLLLFLINEKEIAPQQGCFCFGEAIHVGRLRQQARFANSSQSVRPLAMRRQGEFPLPEGQTSGCLRLFLINEKEIAPQQGCFCFGEAIHVGRLHSLANARPVRFEHRRIEPLSPSAEPFRLFFLFSP